MHVIFSPGANPRGDLDSVEEDPFYFARGKRHKTLDGMGLAIRAAYSKFLDALRSGEFWLPSSAHLQTLLLFPASLPRDSFYLRGEHCSRSNFKRMGSDGAASGER